MNSPPWLNTRSTKAEVEVIAQATVRCIVGVFDNFTLDCSRSWSFLSIRPKLQDQDQSSKTKIKTKIRLARPRPRPVFVSMRPVLSQTTSLVKFTPIKFSRSNSAHVTISKTSTPVPNFIAIALRGAFPQICEILR